MDQLISVSKIFTEKILRIPDYQRGYAWTEKEIEDFWEDLIRLDKNKNHYVGVLTLEPSKKDNYDTWIDDVWIIEAKKFMPYYVVDGQQRLTTAVILIHTIMEIMKEKNISELNYTSVDEMTRKYLYESREKNKNKTYIYGYEINNPSYEFLIKKIFKESIVFQETADETIYTNNLMTAKNYFYKKLTKLTKEKISEIYTKITQNFMFNMYIISSEIDVFVTFETMNNRGKPLSNLELLKNRLIYTSTIFKVNNNEKQRLRRDINTCWKKIYHILGKSKEKKLQDDEFLVTHFMLFFGKNAKDLEKELYYERETFGEWQSRYLLNKYFVVQKIQTQELTINNCFEYIHSLHECIEYWSYIKDPFNSGYTEEIKEYTEKINFNIVQRKRVYRSLTAMNEFRYISVFLLACFRACNNDNKILLKFLKNFEKYLFLTDFYIDFIYMININLLNFSEEIVKLNKKESEIEKIIEKLDKINTLLLKEKEINEKVIKECHIYGFYRCKWLRYFLYEYEVSLMKKSKNNTEKINRWDVYERGFNSIEHIYPENAKNPYWNEQFDIFTPNQRKNLKNSLGNFVLISQDKNSRLGNKPFPEKKFQKDSGLGYKNGSYSEIELTEYKDWNYDNILDRGLKFINFLHERWGIIIGDKKIETKKEFLGLNFK